MDKRAALEAAIDDQPDQAANYLVLADLLTEAGDPRGEFIVAKAAKPVPSLGPKAWRTGSWDWFYGYVRSIHPYVGEDDADELSAWLDHPSMRFLQHAHFSLGGGEDDDRQWLVTLLASTARPTLRTLTIDSYWRGGNDPPAGALDLDPLWDALPRAVWLAARSRWIAPGSMRSRTLQLLRLDGFVDARDLAPLAAGACPNLRELELHDTNGYEAAKLLAPIASQLEKCVFPYARDQKSIRDLVPVATFFPEDDGDRYERVGE